MGKGAFPRTTSCSPAWPASRPHAVGQPGIPGERRGARDRRPVRRPAHRRPGHLPAAAGSSSTSTSSRPRSARCSSPTSASSGTPGRRSPRSPSTRAAARAARAGGEWPAGWRQLRATLLRRDDFDDVPIKPPRVLPGAQRVLRPGHDVRHRDRAVPDLVRPVPAHVPAAALPGVRPGRPAGLGGAGRDRGEVRLPDARGRRGGRGLLLPVPHGGDRGRGAVPDPVRHRDGQQRVPRADPAGGAAATT